MSTNNQTRIKHVLEICVKLFGALRTILVFALIVANSRWHLHSQENNTNRKEIPSAYGKIIIEGDSDDWKVYFQRHGCNAVIVNIENGYNIYYENKFGAQPVSFPYKCNNGQEFHIISTWPGGNACNGCSTVVVIDNENIWTSPCFGDCRDISGSSKVKFTNNKLEIVVPPKQNLPGKRYEIGMNSFKGENPGDKPSLSVASMDDVNGVALDVIEWSNAEYLRTRGQAHTVILKKIDLKYKELLLISKKIKQNKTINASMFWLNVKLAIKKYLSLDGSEAMGLGAGNSPDTYRISGSSSARLALWQRCEKLINKIK